jgi:hypothetical protein
LEEGGFHTGIKVTVHLFIFFVGLNGEHVILSFCCCFLVFLTHFLLFIYLFFHIYNVFAKLLENIPRGFIVEVLQNSESMYTSLAVTGHDWCSYNT